VSARLNPTGKHLLVRRVEPQAVSKGGIIIPDSAKKKPFEAEVLAVGSGWRDELGKLHLVSIMPGERVFFGAYHGTEVGEQLFLSEDDVLAVIGKGGESLRAYQDNVVLMFEPAESLSTVLHIMERKPKHRLARVMLSGPGYVTKQGVLIENSVRERDRVVVQADAGQDYALDVNIPRFNKGSEFESLFGQSGNFRIVREEEILGVVEADVKVVH
jgi:chaperonin GroES